MSNRKVKTLIIVLGILLVIFLLYKVTTALLFGYDPLFSEPTPIPNIPDVFPPAN